MPPLDERTKDIEPAVANLRSAIAVMPWCVPNIIGAVFSIAGTTFGVYGFLLGFAIGAVVGILLGFILNAVLGWMIHVLFLLKNIDTNSESIDK